MTEEGRRAGQKGAWSSGIGVGRKAGSAGLRFLFLPRGGLSASPSPPPPGPRRRKEHLAGFLTAFAGRSPPPRRSDCALSARPPRSAQARAGGAERAAATLRNGTGRANQEIHFRVVRAPFCEGSYKGSPASARPFSCCWERGGCVYFASASQRLPASPRGLTAERGAARRRRRHGQRRPRILLKARARSGR